MLSATNVQIVLNALASITNVNVVSSPQLLVLNNETAQLQVGQQVPVPVQQQQSVVTPEAPLVNTISYLNTGVILSVTPRANANGEVTLDIEQEVSDVATTTTAASTRPPSTSAASRAPSRSTAAKAWLWAGSSATT